MIDAAALASVLLAIGAHDEQEWHAQALVSCDRAAPAVSTLAAVLDNQHALDQVGWMLYRGAVPMLALTSPNDRVHVGGASTPIPESPWRAVAGVQVLLSTFGLSTSD